MPIYTYMCKDCLLRFTEISSISDRDGAKTCQFCGGTNTRRELDAPNITLFAFERAISQPLKEEGYNGSYN